MTYIIEAMYNKSADHEEIINEINSYKPTSIGCPLGLKNLDRGVHAIFEQRRPVIKLMKSLDDKCQITIRNHLPKSL